MTYSVYNIKIDNELYFNPGPTAGNVLAINSDGSTSWVDGGGGGAGGGGGIHSAFLGIGAFRYTNASVGPTGALLQLFTSDSPNSWLYPYYPASSFNIDGIQSWVRALGKTASNYFITLYNDGGGYPYQRLYITDPIAQSVGVKNITATFSFMAGNKYWIGLSQERGSTWGGLSTTFLTPIGTSFSSVGGITSYIGYTIATHSLPSTIDPNSLIALPNGSAGGVPFVNFKVV